MKRFFILSLFSLLTLGAQAQDTLYQNNSVTSPDLTQIRIKDNPGETLEYIGKIGNDFNTALDSLRKLKGISSEIIKEPLEVIFDYDDRLFFGISYGECGMYSDVLDTKGYYYLKTWYCSDEYYRPLAKEGKVWNCKRILSNKSEWEHYSYMVQGDTVINDLSYKKVYLHKSDFQMYAAALRDVGSRTYIVQAGTDFERIYCEMDIDVLKRASDTVCVYIPYGTPRVINTDGVPLKDVGWIVTVGGVGPTTTYNWIEGVGAPDEIFMPTGYAYMRTFEAGVITSCYEDGVCIWHDGEDVVNPPSTPLLISHEYKPGADKSQSPSRVWGEYNANMYWTVYFEDAKTQYSVSLRHPDGQIRHRDETSTLKGNIFYEAWGLAEGENTITFENDNETFTIHVTWPWEPETYRPFIEDGKVWHTGINPGNGFLKRYEYRLFGDTVIDGKTCRVLGRSELKFNAYFYTLKGHSFSLFLDFRAKSSKELLRAYRLLSPWVPWTPLTIL